MNVIKHSKYKNPGVLFELLARQITEDTMNEKDSNAVSLVRRYFKKGTELNKELFLYNILMKSKVSDCKKAENVLNEILKQRKKLNNQVLRKQKYNLIKEIRDNYDVDGFFDAKINNYKVLASIYKLFESEILTEAVLNPMDILSAKETITEKLYKKPEEENKKNSIEEDIDKYIGDDTELLLLSYRILVEKFNKKYDNNLSSEQKMLVRKYINSVSNDKLLTEYVKKQIPTLRKKIETLSKNIDEKETVIHIKIKELSNVVGNLLKENKITENHLVQLLKYYELLREMKNLGKKNDKK